MSISRWRAVVGLVVLAAGCLLTLLSFTVLPWYRWQNGPYAPPYGTPQGESPPRTFADLRAHFEISHTGFAGQAYFVWLAWTLLAAVFFVGVAGAARAVPAGQSVAAALGVVGAWATYVSFGDIVEAGGSVSRRADVGVWVAMIGFVIAGAGAAVAQRTRPTPSLVGTSQRPPASSS